MTGNTFLIITENYLKQCSIINDNTDAKILTPIIQLVQKKYIEGILGTDLYDEIAAQIIADTVTSLNQTLLDDYILPVMHWFTLAEATPAFKYKYMNKGVMVKNSDNSSAADLSEIKYLIDRWEANAKMYAERTTKFLKVHTDDYPLYCANTDCDDIKPNKSNYKTSIYLGDQMSEREEYLRRIGK